MLICIDRALFPAADTFATICIRRIAVESREIQEGAMPTSPLLLRSGNIPALTGLRFFAALMVFFSHYTISGLNENIFTFLASGYSGVVFFFVLSGFIIAYTYLDRFESKPLIHTPRYLWARFCRVYPLYFLTMAFAWFQEGGERSIAIYLFAMQSWHPNVEVIGALNAPAWSISVEAFLYLTFPLLLPLFDKAGIIKSKSRLIGLAALIVLIQFGLAYYLSLPPRDALLPANPNSAHRWLYNFPLFRVLDFSLGILAAVFFTRHSHMFTNMKMWRALSYVSLSVVLVVMSCKQLYYSAYSWDAAYAGAFTLLILSLAMDRTGRMSKFLSTKKIVFLGEASFAFYMIHMVAFPMFAVKTTSSLWINIAFELIFLGLVITMSIGLHLTVEKPCRDFLNKLFPKSKVAKTEMATAER